ncbi:restriction endonuclease subunit S [Helicobacter sp. MIT 01-3238]|uniref:restriction endonuclease subunit S n=1 Tax=Helicobacter sp. MIT 01-3238 TaxID=398627 RepID=UPI001C6A0C2D|nr:restriction endonuclease subunit S [Helicobacter sp. MIT 01-3238]
MQDFSNLPKSWQVKTLGEVCDIISKGATPKIQNKTADKNSALFLKAENVTKNGCVNFDNVKFIDYKTHTTTLKRSMLKNLDILITIAGSLARCAVLEIKPNQQININQAVSFARLKDTSKVNPYFVKYFIMNPTMQLYLLSKAKTTAVPNLTLEIIRDTKIPIPPLEIQRRIVKRLDEAFSRIKNGTKHLKSAKDNLTKYKQSLLKSAFNGTLTQDCPLSLGKSTAESSLRENPQGFSWQPTHSLSQGESTTKQSINTHPLAPSAREGEQEDCHTSKVPSICGGDLGVGSTRTHKVVDCHESLRDSHNDENSPSFAGGQGIKNSPSLAEGARGWVSPLNDNALDCHADKSPRNDDKDLLNGESANLPQGWTIKTLGEVCEINPKNKLDDNLEVSFIPMNLILDKFQNKFSYETKIWKNIKKGYTHLQNNCIALAKITPCFENGKCVILDDLKNGYGAGTTEIIILLPNTQKVFIKYIFYFLNTQNFIE